MLIRLDYECIRDLLLAIEDAIDYRQGCDFVRCDQLDVAALYYRFTDYSDPQKTLLTKWNDHVLLYHLEQCIAAGLVSVEPEQNYTKHLIQIRDLTPLGHEYINNIRGETIWKKTKDFVANMGGISLNAAVQFASTTALQYAMSAAMTGLMG